MKPHKHFEIIVAWASGANIELMRTDGTWMNAGVPTWSESCAYRIKPEPPKYPQTKMTEGDICSVYYNGGPIRGPDEELVAFYRIANAAIARAIEDGDVITLDEHNAAIARSKFGDHYREEMVPAAMLEKVYNLAIEAAAERLQHKSWTAMNGYDPSAKRIILDELMNINKHAIIAAVKEAK